MLGYDMNTGAWHSFPPLPRESMDHRRLVTAGDLLVLVGGMEHHQTVSDGVLLAPVAEAMAPRPRH